MENLENDLIFHLDYESDLLKETTGKTKSLYVAIVPYSESKPEDLMQLQAIYKSIGIDFNEDVLILALHTLSGSPIRLKEQYPEARYYFLFGVAPDELGFSIPMPLYTMTSVGDVHIILTETPGSLQKNIESKRKLWTSLKQHFQI